MVIDTNSLLFLMGGVLIFLLLWVSYLERKIRRLVGGTKKGSLEEAILNLRKQIAPLQSFGEHAGLLLKEIERRLGKSIQAVETVRFNPFKGTGSGGNQSFSTAFLNEAGDGVILSSLYSRDRVSVFSKAIKNYSSEIELSDEEKGVLEKAKQSLGKK